MTSIDILDNHKAEMKIAEYMSQSVPCGLITLNDIPYMLLKNYTFDHDAEKQIFWKMETSCINNVHFFMFLTTGNKDRIALPICLLDDYSKKAAEILLATTKDEKGRTNSKDAEFFIVDSEGTVIKVKVSLAPLSLSYHLLKIFPKSHLLDLKSEHCTFCNPPR